MVLAASLSNGGGAVQRGPLPRLRVSSLPWNNPLPVRPASVPARFVCLETAPARCSESEKGKPADNAGSTPRGLIKGASASLHKNVFIKPYLLGRALQRNGCVRAWTMRLTSWSMKSQELRVERVHPSSSTVF